MSFDSWKEILPAIPVLLTALGLAATAIQIRRNLTFQRENTAKSIYRDYLKLAVENPKLADGEIVGGELFGQYKWFVAYFLWACEEVLVFAPEDTQWREDVFRRLNYHATYLKSNEFRDEEMRFYSDELKALIGRVQGSDR